MGDINDTGVKMPATTTFGAIALKGDYMAAADGKHYTKLNASQAFDHNDRTLVAPGTNDTVLAKVHVESTFADPVTA